MRDIKFRAWSIAAKKFDEEVAITLDGDLFEWNEGSTDEGSIFWKREDYYILSQFTGLKDSRGVEIYEGDIVNCENSGEVGRIEWSSKGAIGWSLVTNDDPLLNIGFLFSQYVYEIIGNIYENPELVDE